MFILQSIIQRYSDIMPRVTIFFGYVIQVIRVSANFYQQLPSNLSPMNNNEDAAILKEQAYEVMESIEDNVEYLCDEYMMSGEKVWVMISALCDAKLAHFPQDD